MLPPPWQSPAPQALLAPRAATSALLRRLLRPTYQRLRRHAPRLRQHPKSKVSWHGSRACSVLATRQHQPLWQHRHPQHRLTPLHAANRAVMAATVKAGAAVADAMETAKAAGTAIVKAAAATQTAMVPAMPTATTVAAVANALPKVAHPATQKAAHRAMQSAAPKAEAASPVKAANPANPAMAVTVAAAAVTQSHATRPLA